MWVGTRFSRSLVASVFALLAACDVQPPEGPSRYLYVWMYDADGAESDFLAVVDADPRSESYGDVIGTEPVDLYESLPHHIEYELPPDGEFLFANAHVAEKVLLFDFRDPTAPRLVRTLDAIPPFRYPHDMVRLPNGNVLVGFLRSDGPSPLPEDPLVPGGHGGIAEVTPTGDVIRSASAWDSVSQIPIRPYSFVALPDIDRMVLTSAAMFEEYNADVVQVWRLSTLELLNTIPVPPALLPDGTPLRTQIDGKLQPTGHRLPFEPRLMTDGSVLLNAYGCGFYRITEIASGVPTIENVYTIEVPADVDGIAACGIPVVSGRFWIMTVGTASMLVTLDVSDPARPHEVSRLSTGEDFKPHWLAKDPGSNRLIVGAENGGEDRMLMVIVDPRTGELSWDEALRSAQGTPAINFSRTTWPHGETGEAKGHAALFRR